VDCRLLARFILAMKIHKIYVTQRKLRNPAQVTGMVVAIRAGECLPRVILAELEDGTVEIQDGHHRCLAYWLSGREELEKGEYLLVQLEGSHKRRFGKIEDLENRRKKFPNSVNLF
jgi:hypothetical protein